MTDGTLSWQGESHDRLSDGAGEAMTAPEFVGVGLIAVSLLHLIPAITIGEIPARWPFAPLAKETQPQHYKVTFAVFSIVGTAGAILLTASLLVRLIHYLQGA